MTTITGLFQPMRQAALAGAKEQKRGREARAERAQSEEAWKRALHWHRVCRRPAVRWEVITGCSEVSAGCDYCYARLLLEQWRGVPGHKHTHGFDITIHENRWEEPYEWEKPSIVGLCMKSDIFHADIPAEVRRRVFDTIRETPQHVYSVLTKRTASAVRFFEEYGCPENAWVGVSVENQEAAFRIDHLRLIDTPVRSVACGPLLGPIQLTLEGIHWVSVIGEYGPKYRAVKADWIRSIRDQCESSKVALLFLNWGGDGIQGTQNLYQPLIMPMLDGQMYNEKPGHWALVDAMG